MKNILAITGMVFIGLLSNVNAESLNHGHNENHSRFIQHESSKLEDSELQKILNDDNSKKRNFNTTLKNHIYEHFEVSENQPAQENVSDKEDGVKHRIYHKRHHSKYIMIRE